MTAATPETTAPPTGRECTRCAHPLRPDWNFCPTCSLPVRDGGEVLSSQIEVLRTEAAATADAPAGIPAAVVGAGLALLVAATATVGVLVWSPVGTRLVVPPRTPTPEHAAKPRIPPEAVRINFVALPAGDFRFGPPEGGKNWRDVGAVDAFEIARYETTNLQWLEYLLDRREDLEVKAAWRSAVPPYWEWRKEAVVEGRQLDVPAIPEGMADFPVRGVSYEQAEEFCRWLDASGRAPGARLPREDEWERAARGTDGRTYPWGDSFLVKLARVSGREPERPGCTPVLSPVSVTDTDRSPEGLCHMGGNVSEWTDLWGGPGEEAGPRERYRIIRGSSYQDGPEDAALYARTWNNEVMVEKGTTYGWVGFRVARDARPAAKEGR